jgi:hypothetical protein
MAIAKNGLQGNYRGRIGNVVYYVLNGKNVSREIGFSTKPPTELQLQTRLVTKLCSELLCKVLDFIKTGFSVEAVKAQDNAFNQAVKYNKKNIVKGSYPVMEIAYDQLLLSKGELQPAENWQVQQTATGLQFSWFTDPKMAWPAATDQVMLLAYFPEQEEVVYTLFGNNRLQGNAQLEIPAALRGGYMETYMSFIAADRKQLADSTYTGSFNQENPHLLALNS